jgi:uncharacterized protein (DUF885 family)
MPRPQRNLEIENMNKYLIAFLCAVLSGPLFADDSTEALHKLFDDGWERSMRENPTWASQLGDRRYNDQWPDLSLAAIEASHAGDRDALDRLEAIDRDALSKADQLNYDLFQKQLGNSIEGYQYRMFLIPLNQRGGIQNQDEITTRLRFQTEKDYEDWIGRLKRFGVYADQTIALMKQGMEEGMVPPRVIMERIPDQIAAQLVGHPGDSPYYAPFKKFPDSFDSQTSARLSSEALAAIEQTVLPAYVKFQGFFNDEYLGATRDSVGASDLPAGKDFYEYRAKFYTTTDLTPDEIHQIGLKEVERIRGEMERVITQVEFEGSFEEFLEFLRTDPQFYYEDPDALYQAYLATSKRLDPALVTLFGKLPRMPYGVRPIPDSIAPDTTTAYYSGPAADGSRPGYYWVNLYKPEVRPKYEIEVLSVHEAVPGHHLQISLAMELGELPNFRRYGGVTAFSEGWGLYSESLGYEMGLYQDPYSEFGALTYDMWRAVRLVVDTGIHYKGWSRQQAIDFFMANAAKTEHDIVNEIDRYIAWPGQALAYKIGQLKIRELRTRAEEALGDDFDIRAFHDTVLGSGAVPLDVLETKIDAWIASMQEAT